MSMRQLKITKSITNRESQSLERYLQEIGRLQLTTAEEEVLLARQIKQHCPHSLDRLVNANLRFVVSVAKQYQNQGLTLSDLINEGNVGLIKAASRFDETRGFKFISYAVWWIRQSIMQALAEQSRIVRLPLNKVGLTNRIAKAYNQLEQEYEREPSPAELALVLEIDQEEVATSLSTTYRHISIDAPLNDSEDGCLIDVLVNPNAESASAHMEYHESLQTELNRSLATLTERQKQVICFFFGIGSDSPLSLEDIGRHFHLTRERVRQIKDKAISRLQNGNRSRLLKVYLG